MTSLALLGASGRMGRAVLQLLAETPGVQLTGALASATSPWIGRDLGLLTAGEATGVLVSADAATAIREAAVAIDFTLPAALRGNLAACRAAGIPIVIGTTGFDAAGLTAVREAATRIAVLLAPNMSLGVNLLLGLVRVAAGALGPDYDVEIFEAHHRHKKDAPSGTALALGEAVAAARGVRLDRAAVWTRHGTTGERQPGTIGFSVLRAGDIVGEHEVTLAGTGERLELVHRAHDRSCFARGALRAAAWLIDRPPGLYSMQDVLELERSLRAD